MQNDPFRGTINRFLMVKRSDIKSEVLPSSRRCASTHIKHQCQRPADHPGAHHFWREIPLLTWRDHTSSEEQTVDQEE